MILVSCGLFLFVLLVLVLVSFCCYFFSFGTCLETGFRTGDSLGFYLLINFPTGWRKINNCCECSFLCYTGRKIALSYEMYIPVPFFPN